MIKKIKNFQLCFYDKVGCYDENFYDIDEVVDISYAIECLTNTKTYIIQMSTNVCLLNLTMEQDMKLRQLRMSSMKYPYETEEEFIARQKEARSRGECVFRDDNDREMILDIIDDYLDIVEALEDEGINNG